MEKFWLVKGDGPAQVQHFSQDSAEQEAQRLACLHPGKRFFVLEAVAMHRTLQTERVDLRDSDGAERPF